MYAQKLEFGMKKRTYMPKDEKDRAIDIRDNMSRIVNYPQINI